MAEKSFFKVRKEVRRSEVWLEWFHSDVVLQGPYKGLTNARFDPVGTKYISAIFFDVSDPKLETRPTRPILNRLHPIYTSKRRWDCQCNWQEGADRRSCNFMG